MQKRFGLIGYPLGHSMSPFIQSRLFELNGIDASYVLRPFPAEEFPDNLEFLHSLSGFNVTIPHKRDIIKYLSGTAPAAALYGAVNTVKVQDGRLYGYNTDAYGFMSGLRFAGISLYGKVLVYGYGGAARTIAFEAVRSGCALTICTRPGSTGKAAPLAAEIKKAFGAEVKIIDGSCICGKYDLFVNATPVGMYPKCNESILDAKQLSHFNAVFDTVYNPYNTKLLQLAEQLGIPAANGLAMLVCQAAASQSIWCDISFTREQLQSVIDLTAKKLTDIGSAAAVKGTENNA